MTDTSDFLIVGAGIAGASVAWELARNHSVTLLEAEAQPGFHATGRSAAFFSEIYGNALIRSLTAASRSFFESPPADFSDSPLLEPRGCVIFADQNQQADLEAHFAELRTHSDRLALESAEFALARVPVLRPEHVAACIWEPDAQRIDVHSLFQGYLRGCRQRSGQLVANAHVDAASFESGAWSVTTPAGNFSGRVLVNAGGAWADEVAELAGVAPVGLTPLRRTVCIVATERAVDSSDWPAVTDAVESFYFVPDAGHLLLSPADETPAPAGDAYPDDLDVARAVDRLETATTLQVGKVIQEWAGLRTFSPDRSPVVGFDAQVDNFFWLAGQGGYGIQTAPALARLAAQLLVRGGSDAGFQPAGADSAELAPTRFRN